MKQAPPDASSASLKIVSGFPGQLRYIDACHATPAADKGILHKQHVADPCWARCVAGGEMEKYAAIRGLAPIMSVDALAAAIAELQKHDIDRLARDAFAAMSALLTGPVVTLWILAGDPEDPFTVGMAGGVNGSTVGAGKIWLHLVPRPGWQDRVLTAFAHEYHHSVFIARHYRGEKSKYLLNYLIMEGMACAFAEVLAPGKPQPWTQTIPPGQDKRVWAKMLPHLDCTSEAIMSKFIFGHVDGLPPMCGYGIGYGIVKAYLAKYPDVRPEEWTSLPARELLEASGYRGDIKP